MDNFNLDELMDLAEAYVGPMIDAIYRRLMDRDFALEDPEVVMLLTAVINILGHDNRGDRPTEVLLMAAYGERGVLDRPNMRVMRWRNGALSGSDLANEPGLGSSRTYQPGEMPLPSKPKPGLTRMHREMNSEAASSGSPLRAAVPPKRAKVEQGVQTNQTMQDLDGMKDGLERTRKELDEVTKTMLITEEPMQQGNDQADREDDKASTGGISGLDFNFLADFKNNADTLEAAEPADEGTSTLEPPSAFTEMKRNLPESSSPGNSKDNEQRLLMESPRRRRIEGAARVPFLGTLPEEEWEVHHRDHENRTGCKLDKVAFMKEVWTVVQSYGTQSILKVGLNRPLMREVLDKLDE